MPTIGCCRYCSRPAPIKAAKFVARAGGWIFCDPICERALISGLSAAVALVAMAAGD